MPRIGSHSLGTDESAKPLTDEVGRGEEEVPPSYWSAALAEWRNPSALDARIISGLHGHPLGGQITLLGQPLSGLRREVRALESRERDLTFEFDSERLTTCPYCIFTLGCKSVIHR